MPMYGKECIHCKKMFECSGKEKDKPCVNFEKRKGSASDGEIQNHDSGKIRFSE